MFEEDSALLEHPKFEDEKETKIEDLGVIEQIIVLAIIKHIQKTKPFDDIAFEEVEWFDLHYYSLD